MPRAQPPQTLLLRSRALARSPAGRVLLRLSVCAALLLVTGLVMRQARAQAYRLPATRLSSASLVFEDVPSWADRRVRDLLSDPALLPIQASIFDPGAEAHVRTVLLRHPLIRRVQEVRLVYPRRVAVKVTLRTPACWAETPRRRADGTPWLMLLSSDARPLEERCYEAYLASRPELPVLTGLERMQAPTPGVPWDNLREQVAEGLAAAQVAERLSRDLEWRGTRRVARIDVARFPARAQRDGGEVLLVLDDGTPIEWGRTERDLTNVEEEDAYETKLERLRAALRAQRPGGAPQRIDVRFIPGTQPSR